MNLLNTITLTMRKHAPRIEHNVTADIVYEPIETTEPVTEAAALRLLNEIKKLFRQPRRDGDLPVIA